MKTDYMKPTIEVLYQQNILYAHAQYLINITAQDCPVLYNDRLFKGISSKDGHIGTFQVCDRSMPSSTEFEITCNGESFSHIWMRSSIAAGSFSCNSGYSAYVLTFNIDPLMPHECTVNEMIIRDGSSSYNACLEE